MFTWEIDMKSTMKEQELVWFNDSELQEEMEIRDTLCMQQLQESQVQKEMALFHLECALARVIEVYGIAFACEMMVDAINKISNKSST